nr:transporter substrate-binding domain-containing protein [Motiliproteus sediminis]
MSEEYPPYNFTDAEGNARGVAVDSLALLWQQLGLSLGTGAIEFLPWARGYARLQREPNTALFAMTYTPSRVQQFRFVGPLVPIHMVLLARRDSPPRVTSDDDLKSLRLGVVREDIGQQLLLERGVDTSSMVVTDRASKLVELLQRGRVDAIAYSYDVVTWNMREAGVDPQNFTIIYTLLEGELGYAFHRDTDPALLQRLQQGLEQLQQAGEISSIRAHYLGTAPAQAD